MNRARNRARFVYIGTEYDAREHAELWRSRFCDLLDGLEISYEVVVANDPFFGRMGRLLAESQRQKALKYEFVVPITSEDNEHQADGHRCREHYPPP